MAKWSACVVYPVYFEVEADSQEDAEERALDEVDRWFDISSIRPVVNSIYAINEDGNPVDEYENEL